MHEDEPLGTAGALHQVEDLDEPFLAMNGDILTDLHYGGLMDFHHAGEGALTIAFTAMDKVLEIDTNNLVVVTQPGIINAALKKAVATVNKAPAKKRARAKAAA